MAQITFITGGARSGKSSFAQKQAEMAGKNPVYLATARVWDEDFRCRIERHRKDRGPHWINMEEEKQLSACDVEGQTVLLDCITLWLTNIYYDNQFDADRSLEEAIAEWDRFVQKEMNLIVVSNELGMGVHPVEESARKFADLQGWMNQYIARQAAEVFLLISGIAVKIKDTRHKIRDTRHKIIDTGHKIRDTGHKIRGTRHKTQDTGHKIIDTRQ